MLTFYCLTPGQRCDNYQPKQWHTICVSDKRLRDGSQVKRLTIVWFTSLDLGKLINFIDLLESILNTLSFKLKQNLKFPILILSNTDAVIFLRSLWNQFLLVMCTKRDICENNYCSLFFEQRPSVWLLGKQTMMNGFSPKSLTLSSVFTTFKQSGMFLSFVLRLLDILLCNISFVFALHFKWTPVLYDLALNMI